MQCNYSLLLTLDELQNLSPSTKAELAQKSPEFAKLTGTPTPQNPPDRGDPTRQVMQQGNQQIVLPDRNQVNQQNSPAVNNPMMNGAAPPAFQNPFPPQPAIAPIQNGVPQGFPPQPQHVAQPLPGMTVAPTQQFAQQQAQQPPQYSPPQQPQQFAQQAPPQQFAPPQQAQQQVMDVQYIRNRWFSGDVVTAVGPDRATKIIQTAAANGILPTASLTGLNDQNVAGFVSFVQSQMGA